MWKLNNTLINNQWVKNEILKEISPGCSLEGMMLKLKLQYFGHLMRWVDSLENTLMLGGIGGRRRRGWQRMASPTRLTWVWVNSGSWWWTGRPQFSSVQFSHSVVSDSLQPHELQHARPPCPSPAPRAHSNSCPSSQWCHPTISFSVVPFSSCPQSLPASGFFQNESALRIRSPKYWSFSFSISPSNEHPGLISFRINWLDLLGV